PDGPSSPSRTSGHSASEAERRFDFAQGLQLLVEPVDVLLHLDDAPLELAEWAKRPTALLGHVRLRAGAPLPERAAQVAGPEDAHHSGDAQPSTHPSAEHAVLPSRCACAYAHLGHVIDEQVLAEPEQRGVLTVPP